MVVGIPSTRGEPKQGRIPRNKIIHAAFRAGGRRVKGEEGGEGRWRGPLCLDIITGRDRDRRCYYCPPVKNGFPKQISGRKGEAD